MKTVTKSLLLAAALAATTGPVEARDYKMAMSWTFEASHVGFVVAQDKGLYKAEGVTVAVDRGYGAADTMRRLVTGDIDFGYIDAALMIKAIATDPKNPMIMVANVLQISPYDAVYVKNRNVKGVADLAIAKFGDTGGSVAQLYPTFMTFAMKNTGKPADTYPRVQLDAALRIPALLRGDVDTVASITYEMPLIQAKAKEVGLELAAITFPEVGFDPYTYGLVVTRKFADAEPETVRKVVDASLKGWQWSCQNPKEAAAVLAPHHTDAPPESIPAEVNIILKDVGGKDADAHGLGYMNPTRWEETRTLSIQGFKIDEKTVPAATMIYDPKFMPKTPIKATCG